MLSIKPRKCLGSLRVLSLSHFSGIPGKRRHYLKNLWMWLLSNGVNPCEIHIGTYHKILEKIMSARTLPVWIIRNRKSMKLKKVPEPPNFYWQADRNSPLQVLATYYSWKRKDDSETETESSEGITKCPGSRTESQEVCSQALTPNQGSLVRLA